MTRRTESSSEFPWPPADARAFVASEAFVARLQRLCERAASRGDGDLAAAAFAMVLDWLDRRLAREPGFFASPAADGTGPRFESADRWWAYARRAVRHAALEAKRSRRRGGEIEPLPDDSLESRGNGDPARAAISAEDQERLVSGLTLLGPTERALVRDLVEGVPLRQSARRLGLRTSTAHARLHGALAFLRERLG